MAHICQVHPYEAAEGLCRSCGGPFCADCLVYPFGPVKPPYCVPCAVTAAGVRKSARNPTVAVPKETKQRLKEWRKARKRDLASPPPDGVGTWQRMDEADSAVDEVAVEAQAAAEREALRLPPPEPETPTPPAGVNLAPPGPSGTWRAEVASPESTDVGAPGPRTHEGPADLAAFGVGPDPALNAPAEATGWAPPTDQVPIAIPEPGRLPAAPPVPPVPTANDAFAPPANETTPFVPNSFEPPANDAFAPPANETTPFVPNSFEPPASDAYTPPANETTPFVPSPFGSTPLESFEVKPLEGSPFEATPFEATPFEPGAFEATPLEPAFEAPAFEAAGPSSSPVAFDPVPDLPPSAFGTPAPTTTEPPTSFGMGNENFPRPEPAAFDPLPPPPPAASYSFDSLPEAGHDPFAPLLSAEPTAFDPLPPPPAAPNDGFDALPQLESIPAAAPIPAHPESMPAMVSPPGPYEASSDAFSPAPSRQDLAAIPASAIRPPTPTRIPAGTAEGTRPADAKAMLARIAALRTDKDD
ncbi:MAG: hypothetical protein ABW035_05770 [Acidimicrobiales bacterium]